MRTTKAPSFLERKNAVVSRKHHEKARKFIIKHRAGALATTSLKGVPHVATIYCIVDEDLNLYFSTRVEGRKFHNLLENPTVALAFSDEVNMGTVQLTGKAERVESLELEQDILYKLITYRYGEPNWPSPPFKLFERGATNELAIIKVTPFEMTYASFETTTTGRYKPFFEKVI